MQSNIPDDFWAPCEVLPGYMVSKDGQVRGIKGNILYVHTMPSGYKQLGGKVGGRRTKQEFYKRASEGLEQPHPHTGGEITA